MQRMLPLVVLAAAGPFGTAVARGQERPSARTAFELAASRIAALELGNVLYGRIESSNPLDRSEDLVTLVQRRDPPADVAPLLEHADGRVRTLAAIALYDRDEPKYLPDIAALAHDGAASFSTFRPVARMLPPGEDRPTDSRTVADWAKAMVENYMRCAGFNYGVDGVNDEPGFDVYWSARKDRTSCASWWQIRLQRAFGGTSPMPADCLARVRAVRTDLERLPATERAMLLLMLPDLENTFSTEAERLGAARSLGRENLLAVLRREPPGDDPDLHERGRSTLEPYACEEVARFVLTHPNELLAPEDATALLAFAREEPEPDPSKPGEPMAWALWEVAAAKLEPSRSREVLLAGFQRFARCEYSEGAQARAELMIAMWQLAAADDAWLADAFYAEPLVGDFSTPSRSRLLEMLAADGSERARATLTALVKHPGFEALDVDTLHVLVSSVGALAHREIVPLDELWRISHPWAISRLHTADEIARAAAAYPAETARFLTQLAAWRKAVLASLPEWAPSSGGR